MRAHDAMLDLVDERAPRGGSDINSVIGRDEPEAIVSGYRHTAQFDKQQLQSGGI
jgi:hypothetical protein